MRNRLIVVLLVPLFAMLVSLGGAAAWGASRSIQQAFYAEQIGDLGYFVTSARAALRSGSSTVLDTEVARFREVYDADVVVFDAAGGVWASGGAASEVLADQDAERLRLALSGRRADVPEPSFPWALAASSLVEPVFDDGDVIGAVMVSAGVDASRAEILRQILVLSIVAVVSMGLGVLLMFQMARWVLAPVRRLDDAMIAIERGEMDVRVAEDTGPPELRRMTRVFNEMADEIERVMTRQQEFAMNASHELRNPLNALLLRVENLATGLGDDWREDIEETRAEGRRMARILDTLLGLARGGRGDSSVEAVDLGDLVRRRVDAWRDVASHRGISVRAFAGEPVVTFTDVTIVESAMDGVIDNAVKYSPSQSIIVVSATSADGVCLITVTDQGPGLTPEQAERATDRFWRSETTDDVAGTGLGLAIASDLLAMIGGELLVESAQDDDGLRVTLALPDGGPR